MIGFNNAMLREMYIEYATPCDRLVSDPDILKAFTEDYAQRTRQAASAAKVGHQLLALRKIGAAKGGLPRLRRRYFGRIVCNN